MALCFLYSALHLIRALVKSSALYREIGAIWDTDIGFMTSARQAACPPALFASLTQITFFLPLYFLFNSPPPFFSSLILPSLPSSLALVCGIFSRLSYFLYYPFKSSSRYHSTLSPVLPLHACLFL